MSWMLILIQLLPSLIKVLLLILEHIRGLPADVRKEKLADLKARTKASAEARDLPELAKQVNSFLADLHASGK